MIWDIINTPPCRHNIIIVSHGIVGLNRKTPPTEPNKLPISRLGIDSNIISKQSTPNLVDIVYFRPKGVLTALKRIYIVKRSLYKCDVPYRIGEKVLNAIYVWAPLNHVDMF